MCPRVSAANIGRVLTILCGTVRRQGVARPRHRDERGASALEFALVLPVLMLLIGGIIDFGFVLAQQIAFNTAARDAARSAVVKPLSGGAQTCSQVANRARTASTTQAGALGASATGAKVEVAGQGGNCQINSGSSTTTGSGSTLPCTSSAATGAKTSVTVTITYVSTPPFPVPFLGSPTLTARGDFQCEYS